MILMPVWIVEETEEGYRALLGSEPRTDADQEWIAREHVISCVYAPSEMIPKLALGASELKFALLTLKEIPEEISRKMP